MMRSLLFVLAAVSLAGCNTEDAGNITRDTGNLVKHTTQAAGSAQLAGRVWGALANTKDVDTKGLHIDAKDGVVTVSGHVKDMKEEKRVVDAIDNVKGVDKVIDKLRIQP